MIVRVIAILFLIGALLTGGYEVVQWIGSGQYDPLTAGELWYAIHRGSLNLAQAVVQRYVAAWLWDPVIVSVLTLPAWVVLGVPGLVLMWFSQPRLRSRFARRRIFGSNGRH